MGRWRRRWRGVLPLAALLVGAVAAADEPAARDLPPPSAVRDLHYGDVLFRFFQDDYFESVVRLEAARDMGHLRSHAEDAELLSGGLYLSLGLHGEASRIFERLLAGPVPQSVSDRAHFYLARIGYQRGYYAEAERNLRRIRGVLPRGLEPERRLLAANVLMALGRYADAASALADWHDPSRWASYARFNLGVALIRAGDAGEGRRWLEAVGTLEPRDEEQRALRDRANLALGFVLLQQREPEQAATVLSRVQLDGPFTNRALLALGWAEADAGRPDRALVPWLELRAGRVLDSAVQESYLAVPYAYAQLAANGQAAEQYRGAVSAYAAEAGRIDESIVAIRGGGFLDAMLEAAPQDDSIGWLWQLQKAPDAPHTRYLYHLIASHEFQEGLRNYRDLRIMQRNLERWSESLVAFDEMVAAREAVAAQREPRRKEALATLDLPGLEARYAEVSRRATDVAAQRDIVALADAVQATQWRSLADALERIEALPAGAQRDALAERVRILRGSLLWQMDAEYKLRLWRLRSGLRATRAALDDTRRLAGQVAQAGAIAPRDTDGFSARVRGLEERMAALRPRINAAARAQERVLAAVAVRELEAQKARLASYGTQAQFALAALYDGAASGAAR